MGVQGTADARFEPVRECFAEVVRGQAGTGAAFAAWCDGRVVADLRGGWADQGRTDALENTLRSCLGLPPLPDAIV